MLPRSITRRWNLHESTQRGLLRLLFVSLVAIPTMLVLGYLLFAATPWYGRWLAASAEHQVRAQTGLNVTIASVSQPSPDRMLWLNVRWLHPETGAEIATAAQIQWRYRQGMWWAHLPTVEIFADQAAYAWRVTHDWSVCRPSTSSESYRFSIANFKAQYPHGTYELHDLLSVIKSSPQEFQGALSYRQARDPEKHTTHWTLLRHHLDPNPTSKLQLNTQQTTLPCEIWFPWWPALNWLGPEAQFRGKLALEVSDRGIEQCEAQGELWRVQLGQLTSGFAQPWNGMADVALDRLMLRRDSIEEVQGRVVASQGVLEREWLLHALRAFAEVDMMPSVERLNPVIHFHELDANFRLDADGLVLQGRVVDPQNPQGERVLMASQTQAIWPSPRHRYPVESVTRWLTPSLAGPSRRPNETRSYAWLLGHLPTAPNSSVRVSSVPPVSNHQPPR